MDRANRPGRSYRRSASLLAAALGEHHLIELSPADARQRLARDAGIRIQPCLQLAIAGEPVILPASIQLDCASTYLVDAGALLYGANPRRLQEHVVDRKRDVGHVCRLP